MHVEHQNVRIICLTARWRCAGVRASLFERGEKTPTPKISALLRKRPVLLRTNFVLTKDRKRPYYGHFCGKIHSWKSNFLYRYRPEGIFRIFFGLILDPPGTYAFTAKKGKFICTGHFFPHGMAFLEKRGGLVPVYVFIFPAQGGVL